LNGEDGILIMRISGPIETVIPIICETSVLSVGHFLVGYFNLGKTFKIEEKSV
jgi:hypothetical protein